MIETETASPPKKHTAATTGHFVQREQVSPSFTRFHRGSSWKRVSFKHTCRCVVMLSPRPCWRYAVMVPPPSLINPGVQQRAHYFRLKEPRTLLPMLVKVAMFVGSFSLRLSHEAGSSLATLSLLNLQTGMNGDMWASLLSPKPSSTRLRCGHTNSYAQWMEACDAVSCCKS